MGAVTLLCVLLMKWGFGSACKAMSSAGSDPRGAVTAGVLTLVSAEELLDPWLWFFWQITFSGLI